MSSPDYLMGLVDTMNRVTSPATWDEVAGGRGNFLGRNSKVSRSYHAEEDRLNPCMLPNKTIGSDRSIWRGLWESVFRRSCDGN